MKTFKQYVEDYSQGSTKQNLLTKLIKIAWERYNPESRDFFEKMATKDANVRDMLHKLIGSNSDQEQEEPDVISPNYTDANFGNEEI